jgi:hypothetical protein
MTARARLPRLKRKYEVDESYWLVKRWRSFWRRVPPFLRRMALTFKWRRIPKTWELSFIDRMTELKKSGLTFDEVLRSALPQLFGDDGSHVLRTWVGKKGRSDPERFTRTASKMFGASAREVLGRIDSLTDVESLLKEKAPREPPYKSLLEAIQRTDKASAVAGPDNSRELP